MPADEFHTVIFSGIVRGGYDNAAICLVVRNGEVEHIGRNLTEVENFHARIYKPVGNLPPQLR